MKKENLLVLSGVILVAVMLVLMPFVDVRGEPASKEVKTLKIGGLLNFGWSLGKDSKDFLDVIVEDYNKKGGLVIGGERYKIEWILYDTKLSSETGRAAAERLIFRDKVKFIIGDETIDAWIPLIEENKVVACCTTANPAVLSSKYKWFFMTANLQTSAPVAWGWFAKNFPHIKSWYGAYPDSLIGHVLEPRARKLAKLYGIKTAGTVFYPPNETDFSAIATKINAAKPDMFSTWGGGVVQDALLWKALYENGWKTGGGQLFSPAGGNPETVIKMAPVEAIEGSIGSMPPWDLEPPPPVSKHIMELYKAKYKKWEYPNTLFVEGIFCLVSAFEQAGSIDPEGVAAVIGNGLRFETINGPALMVAHKELGGSTRTNDMLPTMFIQQVQNGKQVLKAKVEPDEGYEYCKRYFGW